MRILVIIIVILFSSRLSAQETTVLEPSKSKTISELTNPTVRQFLSSSYELGVWWGNHDRHHHQPDRRFTKTHTIQEGMPLLEMEEASLLGECLDTDKFPNDKYYSDIYGKYSMGLLVWGYTYEVHLQKAIQAFEAGYSDGYYPLRYYAPLSIKVVFMLCLIFVVVKYFRFRQKHIVK